MKVKFHYYYPINIDIDTDRQVDVYIDCFDYTPVPEGAIRIVVLEEPKKDKMYNIVQSHPHLYTHLLTFHEDLLNMNPKAIRFHMLNTWVKGFVSKQKRFSVSTVVGGKNDKSMAGYGLRHDLWHNRQRITIPKEFYLSGNAPYKHVFKTWKAVDYKGELVLGASKEPLFDSMFHIAIENCSIKNYFSEKLLDCFQSRTIPIYYGCTNIDEYFNIHGIFEVKNVDEMVFVCNQLSPRMYDLLQPAMEENYKLSMKYVDHEEQLRNKIIEILQ